MNKTDALQWEVEHGRHAKIPKMKPKHTEIPPGINDDPACVERSILNAGLPAPRATSAKAAHTPEQGDRWQPLRDKLSLRECQYLNTYANTRDIAVLNALVLGIIAQRDALVEQVAVLQSQIDNNDATLEQVRLIERRKRDALLTACKAVTGAVEEELAASGEDEVREHPVLRSHKQVADKARAVIAAAEGRAQ